VEGEGRGVGFAGFDGACEEVEGEELHFVGFVTEVGWNSALSSYIGLLWNAVVLADWFGAGRFATNNFGRGNVVSLSPQPRGANQGLVCRETFPDKKV